ncbi:MAG: SRPBCC family protein [Streptosporangiales bacterium]|jgi:hypothetical protein|nr:SRPBCC family protein [Streptosporangiales bacterium]
MTEPVSVSRRIAAPADALFGILSDPDRHPEIDGSGMLRGPEGGATPLTGVGDAFAMRMRNPDVDDYVMTSRVVEYEPGRRIAWEPVMSAVSDPAYEDRVGVPGKYRWGYELAPDGDATVVTETYDCARSPEWLREATRNGENWIPAMKKSLENLERIAVTSVR